MAVPIAYLNGRWIPLTEATLPLTDAGFASGATVVDNARTFQHRLFRWEDHLARFRHDCAFCHIPLALTDEELTRIADTIIAQNAPLLPGRAELQLATFATPGQLGFYLGGAENGPATLGMMTYPLPVARYHHWCDHGVALHCVGHWSTGADSVLPPRIKHRSRMAWWIIDHLPRPPGTVAIVTDRPGGTLTETSVANLLCVVNGQLCTPPRETILDGISLRVVAELAEELGMRLCERTIPLADLPGVSEAMLVGTGFCIAPIRAIDQHAFPAPGPMTQRLIAAWEAHVGGPLLPRV